MSTYAAAGIAEALRESVRGAISVPGDATYDAARMPFDLSADQRPAAVVEPLDAADVAAAVRAARAHGLAVTAQAGGHGAVGVPSDHVLIRTGALRSVEVDTDARTARVGAGATWSDVHAVSAPLGLHGASGSAPTVGVAGYCLGGGVGWFARSLGYGADSVLAAEIVTAAGEQVRVDDDSDPELMRALRGGGGSFGIVTALEIRLHATPELFGGQVLWLGDHTDEVLRAYRDWVRTVPDELTSVITLFWVPPVPQAPAELHGKWVVWVGVAYEGSVERGCELVSPLLDAVDEPLLDELGPLAIGELGRISKDPADAMPFHYRTELLHDIDDATLAAVSRFAGPDSGSPLLFVQLRHLGGALARPAAVDTACERLDAPFLAYGLGAPLGGPEHDRAIVAALEAFGEALAPHATGHAPLTFVAAGEPAARAFSPDGLERLRAVKRRVDPENVIRANHRI